MCSAWLWFASLIEVQLDFDISGLVEVDFDIYIFDCTTWDPHLHIWFYNLRSTTTYLILHFQVTSTYLILQFWDRYLHIWFLNIDFCGLVEIHFDFCIWFYNLIIYFEIDIYILRSRSLSWPYWGPIDFILLALLRSSLINYFGIIKV